MEDKSEQVKKLPFYQIVDGFRLPLMFSPEAFRSALAYKPRPDDLFIVTYPKCGTTWVQNIVGCIFRNGRPFETGMEFFTQTPFLQLTGAEGADTMSRPGAIKLHLPYHLTPKSTEAKYIYVARNPKDCCVSFYHHTVNLPIYQFAEGSFDDYFELFIEGKADFGDYFETTLSWYEHRNDPNVLFITYEELTKDIVQNTLKIAEFIGPQYKKALEKNEKLLQAVIHHSSFNFLKEHINKLFADLENLPKDQIRNNPDIPSGFRELFGQEGDIFQKDAENLNFVRKGIVGDWKSHLSPKQNARLEKKFMEKLGNTELALQWKDLMYI